MVLISLLLVAALMKRSTGEILNLMSVDSTRLQDLTPYLHALWYSFFQVLIAMILLWYARHVTFRSLDNHIVLMLGKNSELLVLLV